MSLRFILSISIFVLLACDTGILTIIGDLPSSLREVSGTEIIGDSELIWMHNDSSNDSKLYAIDLNGKMISHHYIDAKNKDWEDLTTDEAGNLYIGDFGNNANKRDDLRILKVKSEDLMSGDQIEPEKIRFFYPDQAKYPPKSKSRYFDCEAFIFFNDSLYLFTKSRVKGDFGKTRLYKIPAKPGQHQAIYMDEFSGCNSINCWITSADISPDKNTIALLTPNSVLLFSEFKRDNFLQGSYRKIELKHASQKEGICFLDNNTLLITDEYSHGRGGNLYKLELN